MPLRCFYGRLVNPILDRFVPRLDAAARARFAENGLDPDARLDVFPAAAFYRAMSLLARVQAPDLAAPEAEHRFGAEIVRCYVESDVGRAMASVGAAVGSATMILEAKTFFRTAENFLEIRPALLSDRTASLRIAGTGGHPHLLAGILEAAHRQAGEAAMRVTVDEQDGDRAVLLAAW